MRLELIQDPNLRIEAERVLNNRCIYSLKLLRLVEKAEAFGDLDDTEIGDFVTEGVEVFRWHSEAIVSHDIYSKLHQQHRLIADVVSFKGPHINHLTPRTLDIDLVHAAMPDHGITPKATIEGPPKRKIPILLRQTSFKALEEPISFPSGDDQAVSGRHTARFGEIESRGAALTPKGRRLYDAILSDARAARQRVLSEGGSEVDAQAAYDDAFTAFPDNEKRLRQEHLAYFEYRLAEPVETISVETGAASSIDDLLAAGVIIECPITYEDFLPVSAAGIFQSNLGEEGAGLTYTSPNKASFEDALGCRVFDEFELYEQLQNQSIANCFAILGRQQARFSPHLDSS